jgi:hypothetical protein
MVAELDTVVVPVTLVVPFTVLDTELVADDGVDEVRFDEPVDMALDVAVLGTVLWGHPRNVPCR